MIKILVSFIITRKTTEGLISKAMITWSVKKSAKEAVMIPTVITLIIKSSSFIIQVVTKANFAKNINYLEKTLQILKTNFLLNRSAPMENSVLLLMILPRFRFN